MAPKYKLIYFNSRGLAEITRLCFAAADVEYDDIRNTQETFASDWKAKTPFHHAPCLEVDGCILSESSTLFRYVARNHGLEGNTPLDCGKADMITEVFLDLKGPMVAMIREQDETRKKALMEKLVSETVPKLLDDVEQYLSSNNGGKGFFVGDSLTYCDLVAFEVVNSWVRRLDPDLKVLDSRPLLKAHKERVANLPRIKAWLDKRPQTEN